MNILKWWNRTFTWVLGKPGSLSFNLARNTMGVMIIRALSMGLSFAVSMVLARILGVREFGLYSLAMSVLGFLIIPTVLGLPKLLVREIAAYCVKHEWELVRGLISFSQRFSLLTSLGIALSGSLVLRVLFARLPEEIVRVLSLVFVALPFWGFLEIYGEALRGFGQVLTSQWVSMVMRPFYFLILVGAVWIFRSRIMDACAALTLHIVAAGIALIFAFFLLRNQLYRSVPTNLVSYKTTIWVRSAIFLAFLTFLNLIPQHVGILMISCIRSPEEAGLYKVAYQTSSLVPFGLMAINTAIAPTLAQFYAAGEKVKLKRIMITASALSTFSALPFVFLFIFRGAWFLILTFGTPFAQSAIALGIITLSQLINAATGPVGNLLIMSGHENKATLSLGIGCAIYLFSNAALVQILGINGAAIAFAIAWTTTNLLNLYFVFQIFQTKFSGSGENP